MTEVRRLPIACWLAATLAAVPPVLAQPSQDTLSFEHAATYEVIECRDAHFEHAALMREMAAERCEAHDAEMIRWFSYDPTHCRYKVQGRAPVTVSARVKFACMPR
ncbi:MAG: hypothetical protein R3E87_16545 [Burkholderiaceae bacterium]